MGAYREIVGRKSAQERDRLTIRGRFLSWRAGTDVTTLMLSCGHEKVYRGYYVPRKKVLCKECTEKAS